MIEIEMKFKIKDIQPNPFRNIETYPINREKVEELKRSMDRTDYWGNILGRLVDGKPEIAYGHHRRVALLEKYGDSHMVDIIIRDLHDDDMIQIMASENMDVWASRAIVDIETIHAVVKAYAQGKIQLTKVDSKTKKSSIRYAPSFIPGNDTLNRSILPYTSQGIADFLGWTKAGSGTPSRKVEICITALQYIEEGLLRLSAFEKLNTAQMEAVIDETRNVRKQIENEAAAHERQANKAKEREEEARQRELGATTKQATEEARKERWREAQRREHEELAAIEQRNQVKEITANIGHTLSSKLQSGEIGTRQARSEAYKLRPKTAEMPPHIEDALRKILKGIANTLHRGWDENTERLDEIISYKKHLSTSTCRDAAATFRGLADRANKFAELFEKEFHGRNNTKEFQKLS